MNRQRREGLFRIVVAGEDGSEEIAVPCLKERDARAFLDGYNNPISKAAGLQARGLEVELPRLKRHLPREIK